MVLRASLLVLVLGCAMAACGTDGEPGDSDESPSPTESTSPPMSSTDLPTMTPHTSPPTTPSHQFKPLTLTGRVVAGKPDGCVLLVTDQNLRYALTGDLVTDLTIGSAVTLRGMPAPGAETACAGIVLKVRELLGPSR